MADAGLSFRFTDEQEMIRSMVREFVDRELRPAAPAIDRDREIPPKLIDRARELGFFGMAFPEEYGGSGAGEIGYCLQMEELARGCNSFAGLIGASASITAMTLYLGGQEDLKRRYLPALCSGERIGAYALTEPGGGSDAAAIRTTAVKQGSEWVLNGDKIWITNAHLAGLFVVFAVTDPALRARGGISAFVVEGGTPGLKIGAIDEKMGLCGMHSPQVFLDDVRVPEGNLIGRPGEGFKYAMMALDRGRLSLGAGCVGAAKEVLDASVKYANQRQAFGKPISEQGMIQAHLAEMAGAVYAMDSMVYRTAWMHDAGLRFSREAAIVKYWCTEAVGDVIDRAIQIHGGMGYMRELPLERYYRDARVWRIFEGTNEIQRLVVARDLCKQGRY